MSVTRRGWEIGAGEMAASEDPGPTPHCFGKRRQKTCGSTAGMSAGMSAGMRVEDALASMSMRLRGVESTLQRTTSDLKM